MSQPEPTIGTLVHVTVDQKCRAALCTETANARRGITVLVLHPHKDQERRRDVGQAAAQAKDYTWHWPGTFAACPSDSVRRSA